MLKTEILSAADPGAVVRATRILARGGLVAFPTETVYGVAARSDLPEAVARLHQVKGERGGKPFSLLVGSLTQALALVETLPRPAAKLARLCWPGPVTLVVPGREGNLVGLRLPDCRLARELALAAGAPLCCPSANKSGAPSPRTAAEVLQQLEGEIELLLDGGPTRCGKHSTVIAIKDEDLEVLREGAAESAHLCALARPTLLFVCDGNTCRSAMAEAFCVRELKRRAAGDPRFARRGAGALSAGLGTTMPAPATAPARAVMQEVNLSLEAHLSRPLGIAEVERADWVYVMTNEQKRSILRLVPETAGRVRLLAGSDQEVEDPYGADLEAYRRCRDKIEFWVTRIVEAL